MLDRRIPCARPDGGARADAAATYGSAADERSAAGAADVAVGRFVLHTDGSYLKTDDLRTSGFILSRPARAAALSQVGLPQDTDEPVDFAALRKRLPNSAAETWSAGVGAALITDTGQLGVSYGRYDSFYSIPVRYATAVGQEQEGPRLDLVQDRVDLRADVETGGGFLERVRVRLGHAGYRHFEREETGEIATTFRALGTEGRVELVQADRGGRQGASGVQFFNRRFDAVGEEAFLPRNDTDQIGLFTLQSVQAGPVRIEGGVRFEHSDLAARTAVDDLRYFRGDHSFDAVSGSLGASYAFTDDVRIGVNLSRTERAPSAEELFSNGAHAGTQAYELGDPGFRLEKSWGVEGDVPRAWRRLQPRRLRLLQRFRRLHLRGPSRAGRLRGRGRAVRARGRPALLPVPAAERPLLRRGDRRLARADDGRRLPCQRRPDRQYVRATVRRTGPVPRIPPLVSGNNLFDVVARRHASFLKDFAPLAGRNIRATLRVAL